MRVALFATCFNDTMWPQTPRATVLLLERLGVEVEFPVEQTCCGQMFTNTGYAQEAIPGVRQFIDVFGGYDAVVAPSGSGCSGTWDRSAHITWRPRVSRIAMSRITSMSNFAARD